MSLTLHEEEEGRRHMTTTEKKSLPRSLLDLLPRVEQQLHEVVTILTFATTKAATPELRGAPRRFDTAIKARILEVKADCAAGRIPDAKDKLVILSTQMTRARKYIHKWLTAQDINPKVEDYIRDQAKRCTQS